MRQLQALSSLTLGILVWASCASIRYQGISQVRANIASLKSAVENSDGFALAQLMSDAALRHYNSGTGKVDWEALVEDLTYADQAAQNAIRTAIDEGGITVVGWNSKYHVLLQALRFRRPAGGKPVFDGLLTRQVIVIDQERAIRYLTQMSEEQFQDTFRSPAGFRPDSASGMVFKEDALKFTGPPKGFSPERLLNEGLACIRTASLTLDGIDQRSTAEASRWELEAIAQRGRELNLVAQAMERAHPTHEQLASLHARHRLEIATAWESLKEKYYRVEQSEPRFVRDLGDTIDRLMSAAFALQSY